MHVYHACCRSSKYHCLCVSLSSVKRSTRKDIIHIQDPLNMQQRSIEAFDHVKLDLRLEDEDGEGEGGGVLRNTTEDMKRVLGALQTQEAKASQGKGLE